MIDVTKLDVTALDETESESVNGGIDENGSGVSWALGYSIGWAVNKVETAVDYYHYNFP
jgi:hypothetical protein